MNTLTINHSNGNSTTYQLINDGDNLPIAYHEETSPEVISALERARIGKRRVKIYLGDTATGRDWNEENDTIGYVGLSRGANARYPILVYNKKSCGGGSLLDNCIVKIKESKGGRVLYQSPKYQAPIIEICPSDMPEYQYNTIVNGELYGRHKTLKSAELLKKKLS